MAKSHLSNIKTLNPYLVFCILVYLQGALLFGIDTGSFGSLQALPSFLRQFGVKNVKGVYELPTERRSVMNSVPWIGKLAGCFLVEPLIDRVGYRHSIVISSFIQIVALIIEMTAKSWQQFTVGRNFAYLSVGLVENLVPAYCAEISPSAIRGLLAGSITFVVALGNLWGSGMSRAYVNDVAAEIDAIEEAIALGYSQDTGSWWKIFTDPTNYGRRAWIVASLFIFQQTNGNQFVNSYGPTFYKQSGYGNASFTYAMIGQAMTIVGSGLGLLITDYTGRRPLMIVGGFMCGIILSIGASLGSYAHPNQAEHRTVISTFLLLGIFTKLSASNNAFLIGAEIGGVKMRKKILAFGTMNDVLAAFLVTFVTPYLLANPGPNLGSKVGWIFAAAGYLSGLFGVFFTPELKGRSLEEVNELFEAKLPAWKFKGYQTTGVGHRLTELERHDKAVLEEQKQVIEHVEQSHERTPAHNV